MTTSHGQPASAPLESSRPEEILRIVTCGSMDDGKSTLIGRLLFESEGLFDDQLQALVNDSRRYGAQGGKMDLPLLMDGLREEREQGSAIDVAYRCFATRNRRYILADAPGHEQYTCNMATGASTADVAVILIDARTGVLTQTRRHTRIVALMGIRHAVLIVNKMDLVQFNQAAFDAVVADFNAFAADFKFAGVQTIPASALDGDNVRQSSARTPWYSGPSLMNYLENVHVHQADEVDVSRGDVLAAADAPPQVADQFQAKLLWMASHPMAPGRQYLLKLTCHEVTAAITDIKYRIDVNTGARLAAKTLSQNEIATVNLSTSAPLLFEPYAVNRTLGGFILIDKLTFTTAGAGMIDFALRRASNIHWQALDINKQTRAAQKQQRPQCIWFTGLPGSGKSTIANLLEKRLHADGMHTYLLDGDNVRHGLNRDLGFTEADRVENIRRVAEVSQLMVDAGLIVINAFISPFQAERAFARSLFQPGEFIEVFIDAPLHECMRRDRKGLYAKAARGELQNFTGIDSAYEPPEKAEIHLYTTNASADACVEQIIAYLRAK